MAGFAPTGSVPTAAGEKDSTEGGASVTLNRIFRDHRKSNGDAIFADQAVEPGVAEPPAPASTVTGVVVSPSAATVAGGGTLTLNATVNGTNSPSQAVTWSSSAGLISDGVFIEPAAAVSAQTVTVTATSVQDPTKSGTATVTILAIGAPLPSGTVEFRRMRKNTMRVVRLA